MVEEQMMTLQQTADYLKVGIKTIARYIKQSENPLPSHRLSDRTIRISLMELNQWISDLEQK
jgi:excisionase family DNA binding protein